MFVRTKDKIIDIGKKELINPRVAQFYSDKELKNGIWVENIIKQADTIEELCDELIIKNPNNDGDFNKKVFVTTNRWEILLNEKHAKHCINRDIYEYDVEIFGAIWTYDSDGVPTLKAVAKMNDKGELELL